MPIDGTLTGTPTPGQSGPRSIGIEALLYTPYIKNWSLIIRYSLLSY